jgi:CRP/FNR family cyclic AMP-dependent transcriptional regulator
MPNKPLQEVLVETQWLQQLPANAQERVFADAYEETVEVGCVVARKGEPANSWIGVADGLLKISAVYRSGKVVMFTGIPEGSWIGEGSVAKRELRRYDIIAMRPTHVIHLPGSTFRWLLDTSLEFNHIIISKLNERLAQYIGMVEIDRLTDPIARVARAIGTLYNPVLYPHMSPMLALSQTELGELIGMSRQSISAALKQLAAQGLVSVEYGGVLVRKLPSLVAYQERD